MYAKVYIDSEIVTNPALKAQGAYLSTWLYWGLHSLVIIAKESFIEGTIRKGTDPDLGSAADFSDLKLLRKKS